MLNQQKEYGCLEVLRRRLKAHSAEFYSQAEALYDDCCDANKEDIKTEIVALCDRIKDLVERKHKKWADTE